MPHARSIPASLEPKILHRYALGYSPQKIFEWIEATNKRRQHAVKTSPSSIARLIARYESAGARRTSVAVMQRLRLQAPSQVEVLVKLQAEYETLKEESATLGDDGTDLSLVRLRRLDRARAMRQSELLAIRTIRLAGLGGPAGQKLLEANADLTHEAAEDVLQDLQAELVQERLDDSLQLHLDGMDERKLIDSVLKLRQEAAATAGNAHRLDDGSPSETSTPEAVDGPGEAPLTAVPFLAPLPHLGAAQTTEWNRQREQVNHFLLIAYQCGAANEAPSDLPEPDLGKAPYLRGVVPRVEPPPWPMSPEQRDAFEAQARLANPWLIWLTTWLSTHVPPANDPPSAGAVSAARSA